MFGIPVSGLGSVNRGYTPSADEEKSKWDAMLDSVLDELEQEDPINPTPASTSSLNEILEKVLKE